MTFPDSEPQSRVTPTLQQALAILTEQLRLPDWSEEKVQQPTWERVSVESTRSLGRFKSE